jgi:2-aminoadipate transaminase
VWATLDNGVDTTDLLARSEGVAFVPGRAAYTDGRSGSSSMRLNFAGVADADIREGIRRIGRIMGGDTGLLGTLTMTTGSATAASSRPASSPPATPQTGPQEDEGAPLADVVALPRREQQRSTRRRQDR